MLLPGMWKELEDYPPTDLFEVRGNPFQVKISNVSFVVEVFQDDKDGERAEER